MTGAVRHYVKCEVNLRARQAQRAYDELEVVMGERDRIPGRSRKMHVDEARRQVRQAKLVLQEAR